MNRNAKSIVEARKGGKLPFEEAVLKVAALNSARIADSKFGEIQSKLNGSPIDETTGSMSVNLVCNIQQTTGDVIEAALRKVLGDDKDAAGRPHNVDVIFAGTPIEVKYSRVKFNKLATDSQSLRRRDDKWYIYARGDIGIGDACKYDIWLMRADALYDAVKAYRNISDGDVMQTPSIDEIEKEIQLITRNLATAIWNKSTGEKVPIDKGAGMSLGKRIGLNRVRFDLKFEGLLRAYVKEILRS